MKPITFTLAFLLAVTRLSAAPVPLFDGKTFAGWQGDTADTWRIEDGVLAAGSLEKRLAKSDFLVTTEEFANFELTLQWKVEGKHVNGGVQFRSLRGADIHEVSGYQADLGAVCVGRMPFTCR